MRSHNAPRFRRPFFAHSARGGRGNPTARETDDGPGIRHGAVFIGHT